MNRILALLTCLLFWGASLAQTSAPSETEVVPNPSAPSLTTLAEFVDQEGLKAHLTVLASDEYEGRETGQAGNEKAARYIAEHFRALGLPPIGEENTYFQRIRFNTELWSDIDLKVNDKEFRHLWDFISFPHQNEGLSTPLITQEVIFLGYGISDKKYDDYKGVDVKDKVILIYKGEPTNRKGISHVSGKKTPAGWDEMRKLRLAKERGVKAVFIIEDKIKKLRQESRRYLMGPYVSLGQPENDPADLASSCYISTNVAKEIMSGNFRKIVKARKKIRKRGKARSVKIPCRLLLRQDKSLKVVAGDNVMGYIEGTDPKLKEELVVVTAHYDHLGKRGDNIFNGADDNGSGTSTVLEVAQAMAEAKKAGVGPRRSVLVMLVTGEEKGLLGSKYYTERPVFPLENTIANVNVDMVGRVDKRHADDPNYIYVIGSDRLSTELHEINETANEKYTQLTLDYKYNERDDPNRYYYRSDHYNFAEKGIPAIFYFNGTHKDYHRPSDTVEKINFEKMEKIGRLVFHTAWELANRDKRIEVDVEE
ncbi:MAG: M28 family peptidase [Bacteroidota bacterium]